MINTIIEGDCTEKLKLLSDNSVDIVFTSPPYNVGGTTRTGKNTKKLYEEYGDNLIRKLQKHDMTRLSIAKPGRMEKIINDGTKDLFNSLESITAK